MLDCHQTRELLDFYLDRELESDQIEHITLHVKDCAGCRAELQSIHLQNDLVKYSIRSQPCDTSKLRAEIEAATVRKAEF